jgi:thiol-disulfide isomerase/thioredoxin
MPQVMRESGVAKLRAVDELVDGHACKVIDAHTRRGDYTLWIDPAAGHLFRKARVIKHAGDLSYHDKPVAAHGTEATVTGMDLDLADIQIEKISGRFILTHCVEDWKTFVSDQGNFRLDRSTYTRSHIDLNPDFTNLGAFVMDGFPEGYTLLTLDKDGPFVHSVLHWVHGDVEVTPAPAPMTAKLPSRKPRVGSTPPEIQGVDIAGKPMKLSDYRGKVVVVIFWSNACGPCMTMVPHEREMAEKLKNKPFVLLGVNAWDTHDTAAATIAKEQMTWPSWFDNGMNGPICRLWDIHALPAIFVLDVKGVVRYEDVRGGDLDQAVYSLLEQVQ